MKKNMMIETNALLAIHSIEDFEPFWFFLWIGLFAVCCLIEIFTVRAYANCIAAATIVPMVLSLIPNLPFYYDLIAFGLLSVVFLFLLRPFLVRRWKNKKNSNEDSLE